VVAPLAREAVVMRAVEQVVRWHVAGASFTSSGSS
jgi:hypothetical protein